MIVAAGGNKTDVVLTKNRKLSIMTINLNVKVDFTIGTVLGFNSQIYEHGRHLSEHTVNIMSINSIFVHTNVSQVGR